MSRKKKHRLRNWLFAVWIVCLVYLIACHSFSRYMGMAEAKWDLWRGHHTILVYRFLHFPDRKDEMLREHFGFKYSVVGCCPTNSWMPKYLMGYNEVMRKGMSEKMKGGGGEHPDPTEPPGL